MGTSTTGDNSQRESNSGGSRDGSGRIIMILDGLENFRDNENDQGIESEQSADWVPWYAIQLLIDRYAIIGPSQTDSESSS